MLKMNSSIKMANASLVDWLSSTTFVAALGVFLGVAALFFFKHFSVLLPLLTILLVCKRGELKQISVIKCPPFLVALALILLAAISLAWVGNKVLALKTFLALSFTYIFAVIFIDSLLKLKGEISQTAKSILYISGYVLILLVTCQALAKALNPEIFHTFLKSLNMIKPTGGIIGLFTFIASGYLWVDGKKFSSFFIFALLLMAVYLTECQTAFYSLILSASVLGASLAYPIWSTRFLMIVSYTILLIAPFLHGYIFSASKIIELPLASHILNHSFYHRILAWEWYSKKFFENHFMGLGLEAGRSFPAQNPTLMEGYKMTVHAHNNILQAYVELGVMGGILYALFAASLFWVVAKNVKDRVSVALCNATIVYALIEAQFTHNLWRNYWLSILVLAAGSLILLIKYREERLPV